MTACDAAGAVERVARTAYGRLVAWLAARSRDVAAAGGLALLEAVEGAELYQPHWAVQAHLLAALGRNADAAAQRAMALSGDAAVRVWLAARYRIA